MRPACQVLDIGEPLPRAYSHRDCQLTPPLLQSLHYGFSFVEVDVYCLFGHILVAHDPIELRPNRTLRKLYLEPLRHHATQHGGRIFPDGTQFWLFVDMKTPAQAGFRALTRLLGGYADIVTSAAPGERDGKPLRIILSGSYPSPSQVAELPERLLALDGRSEDLGRFTDPTVMPIISDDWRKHFEWRGDGPLSGEERGKLERMTELAHRSGQMLRFWGTPDSAGSQRDTVWDTLLNLGVDLINTDDVAALHAFLTDRPLTKA